jgi:Putative restriction endonuclease
MYAPVIQASMTFEEFLAWDDGTGRDFELRDGLPKRQKQVMTGRTPLLGRDEGRRADIVVFAKDEWERLRQQSGSAAAYIPPPLAIEVVSTNWRDDYEYKLNEYEALGITEYWVSDFCSGATAIPNSNCAPTANGLFVATAHPEIEFPGS